MLIECLLLIVGLALVVLGADFLVDGASSIAKRFGVSDFVIGLTIVGMGTSAPEMVVSFIGALQGNGDIAIGNVVGSNIFNVFMILGATALILPMDITPMNRKKDIPLNIAITLIFIALGMSRTLFGIGDDVLGRLDGAILLVLFAAYIYMCFRFDTANQTESNENEKVIKPTLAAVLIVAGLAGLVFGGRMFVNSATSIAKMLNVSDKLIAITILAGGTSMPELVTCIVAAFKKKGQLALGNILGSNVFNILLILGGSALIHPLSMAGMSYVDLGALLLSSLVIWASIHTNKKNQLDRADGLLLLILEAAYMTFLIIKK
ncbi:MAG: calcium/sodium antiporter [Bacteroidales bacterium]|jgi:cation:H+ antiporter|nr:calcium/sodium antiporter [Bacteroidales bacterium]